MAACRIKSAEATLRYVLDSGISAIELMGAPAESYARAQTGFTGGRAGGGGRGGGRAGGGARGGLGAAGTAGAALGRGPAGAPSGRRLMVDCGMASPAQPGVRAEVAVDLAVPADQAPPDRRLRAQR